jgi:predicted phosphodiesterase
MLYSPRANSDSSSRVDLIVHTGDFTERAVLEGLRTLGEVKKEAFCLT